MLRLIFELRLNQDRLFLCFGDFSLKTLENFTKYFFERDQETRQETLQETCIQDHCINRENVYTCYVIEIHVVTIKNVHSSILS